MHRIKAGVYMTTHFLNKEEGVEITVEKNTGDFEGRQPGRWVVSQCVISPRHDDEKLQWDHDFSTLGEARFEIARVLREGNFVWTQTLGWCYFRTKDE